MKGQYISSLRRDLGVRNISVPLPVARGAQYLEDLSASFLTLRRSSAALVLHATAKMLRTVAADAGIRRLVSDDFTAGMVQPSRELVRLAVRQQINDVVRFHSDQDPSDTLPAPHGPIVDAKDAWHLIISCGICPPRKSAEWCGAHRRCCNASAGCSGLS